MQKATEGGPYHDPSQFPAGNAKVGDSTLLVDNDTGGRAWGLITRVGLLNEHGYYLDVEVTLTVPTLPLQMSPDGNQEYTLYIVPPRDEVPEDVREWAEANSLTISRKPTNAAMSSYRFIEADGSSVYLEQDRTETAAIYYRDGWRNGKWQVEDNGLRAKCDGQYVSLPKDFEANYG